MVSLVHQTQFKIESVTFLSSAAFKIKGVHMLSWHYCRGKDSETKSGIWKQKLEEECPPRCFQLGLSG